jgi:hypothetical protein
MLVQTAEILKDISIPRMIPVLQNFPQNGIKNIPPEINKLLNQKKIKQLIRPGMNICITVGSRGIANNFTIVKEIVKFVKNSGANPFIIPAMGSHGGSTPQGQTSILKEFGITPESCGCPIISSMETVKIGVTKEGHDVFIDKHAASADGIILYNRIKPHTSFRGSYESGLMKMAAIGLGKQHGAESCHKNGYDYMGNLVPLFGKVVLANAPILFGFGVIENAFEEICKMVTLTNSEIIDKEPLLLKEAFLNMPQIYLKNADVLIIDQIGKEISGAGMDPNVIGRYFAKGLSGGLNPRQIVLLDLTEQSHGNFLGVGLADFTTRRVFNKMNFDSTYANALTCLRANSAYIPVVLDTDRQAIAAAIMFCWGVDETKVKIIRIKNTLQLQNILVSESLLNDVKADPRLEIIGEAQSLPFDKFGNLL